MWPYHPDLLAKPVPRYTSFPTAVEFSAGVGAADMAERLATASGDASLYLHIPYCKSICWYCGCNTGAANRRERLVSYLEALHREIALVARRLEGRVNVRRVAFGGGSPNAIQPVEFSQLVDAVVQAFPMVDPIWSVELDPRTLDDAWEPVLADIGVQRASMGVQTFAPRLQEAIGRVQPGEMIVRGTGLLRRAGVTSINFDLMYGLPGQTMADLEASLARTVELGADRIALFGYAHVPHMIPRQKRIDASGLPGQDERFAMAKMGFDYLTARGYEPIGFDHFARSDDPMAIAAREGRLHRNFQGFTDDDAPVLIGLGASAISAFPDLLVQNEKNAGRYRVLLSQDMLTASGGIVRSPADQRLGAIIEALLCQGASYAGGDVLAAMRIALEPFVSRGLAAIQNEHTLRILPAGLPYARTIAALFDPYRQDSARRFSSAV